MNQKLSKTHIITTIVDKEGKEEVGDKVIREQVPGGNRISEIHAEEYIKKFLEKTEPGTKRSVTVFRIEHILTRSKVAHSKG